MLPSWQQPPADEGNSMTTGARLISTRNPARAQAQVLVLHGGASRSGSPMVSPAQLSVLRMVPIARRIALAGRGRLAVHRLLNSHRGWDAHHTPVDDVRWALDRLADERGEPLPTCLVGHSLGGRAALLAGTAREVRSIVALNPWVYPSDHADLRGRQVLVVHGTADRVADPGRAAAVVRNLHGSAESVGLLLVEGGKHAMLGRGAVFERAAADFARATLLGDRVGPPVAELLTADRRVTV
jgi:pimeloyl-ACP methyl ester carboxylesterase